MSLFSSCLLTRLTGEFPTVFYAESLLFPNKLRDSVDEECIWRVQVNQLDDERIFKSSYWLFPSQAVCKLTGIGLALFAPLS
jgi:hypothetical protein